MNKGWWWWWTKWNGVQGHRKDNHTGLTINIIQLLDGYQIKISIKGQESSRIEDTICQWWWTKWKRVQGHRKDYHTGLTVMLFKYWMDIKSKSQSRVKKVQGLKTQYVKGQGDPFVGRLSICVIVCICCFWVDECWGLFSIFIRVHCFQDTYFYWTKTYDIFPWQSPNKVSMKWSLPKRMAKLPTNSIL